MLKVNTPSHLYYLSFTKINNITNDRIYLMDNLRDVIELTQKLEKYYIYRINVDSIENLYIDEFGKYYIYENINSDSLTLISLI